MSDRSAHYQGADQARLSVIRPTGHVRLSPRCRRRRSTWHPGGVARQDTSELHRMMRHALSEILLGAGWSVDAAEDTAPGGFTLGAFRLPIGPEFSVAVRFDLRSPSGPDGRLPLEVDGTVGVSYERAYRLWPVVQDSEGFELAVDLGELVDPDSSEADDVMIIEISDSADVGAAAEQLTTPVLTHAAAWAG